VRGRGLLSEGFVGPFLVIFRAEAVKARLLLVSGASRVPVGMRAKE
jgi:hypothetical protein